MALSNLFPDVGIDLGTANTLLHVKHKGTVINEPSVAATNAKTGTVVAVGEDAKKMLGRTPAHITVTRPLVGGVISDFDMTQELLRHFLKRARGSSMFGFRRAVVAIPDNLTEVERKSVEDAVLAAGATKAYLVESPVVAALGAGLPIAAPTASLIVDIGGGTTDISVISLGGTVVSKTLRVAGDKFNEDIVRFARDEFKLSIGESSAEAAKILVGSAVPLEDPLETTLRGRDIAAGLPREVAIRNTHVRAALAKSLRTIAEAIREVIEATPPELVGDMVHQGVVLCGGGALLRGIDQMIEAETGVTTRVAPEPLTCVIRGLAQIVDDFDGHAALLDNPLKPLSITL